MKNAEKFSRRDTENPGIIHWRVNMDVTDTEQWAMLRIYTLVHNNCTPGEFQHFFDRLLAKVEGEAKA